MISASDPTRPPTLPRPGCRRGLGRDVSGKSSPLIPVWVSPLFWLFAAVLTLHTRSFGLNPGIISAAATATVADETDLVAVKFPGSAGQSVGKIDPKGPDVKVWEDDDDDDDDSASLSNKANQTPVGRQSSLSKEENRTKSLSHRPDDDDKDNEDESVVATRVTDRSEYKEVGEGSATLDSEGGDPDAKGLSPIEFDGSESGAKLTVDWPQDDDDGGAVTASASSRGKMADLINSKDEAAVGQIAAFESFSDGGSLIHTGDPMPPSSYHRNQSSEGYREGGDTGGDNEAKVPDISQDERVDAKSEFEEKARSDSEAKSEELMASGEAKDTSEGVVENVANGEGSFLEEGKIEPNPEEAIGTGTEQIPEGYSYDGDDEEEDSYFEMVKSTFSILFLAAFLTLLLVFRKRVGDRVSTDSSISIPVAIRDELIDAIVRLASWAISRTEGGGSGSSGTPGGGAMTSSASSAGPETIPLSTATDEEWGWEDDEVGTNLELSGLGGDDAKEDDDLAMAIAMSLSEAENGGLAGGKKASAPAPKSSSISHPSPAAKTAISAKHLSRKLSNSSTGSGSERGSSKNTQKIKESTVSETSPPSAAATEGNSIEDLLGQMGGAGGAVITSFGQRPKPAPKAKLVPMKESSDDIFASMGLSSFPSPRLASAARPVAPTSGGWQARAAMRPSTTATVVHPPRSTPLPSLLAGAIDDDDAEADWGDDGDLDDLLDD